MGILETVLASIDNMKRVGKRNFLDAVTNPAEFASMVQGRVAETNKKLASGDSQEILNAISPTGMGGGLLGTIVGAEAKYSSKEILKAFQRLGKGEDPKQVFAETGIYKGPVDNAARTHVSDKEAKLKIDNLEPNQFDKELKGVPLSSSMTLPDLLDHPELYKLVPELKDIKLKPNLGLNSLGAYNPDTKTIHFSATKADREAESLSTLLHETQHAVQDIFGFTKGGNTGQFIADPELFKQAKFGAYTLQAQKQSEKEALKASGKDTGNIDDFLKNIQDTITNFQKVESDALDSYLRLGGEAESRAVQAQHKNEVFNKIFEGPQQRFIFNKVAPYKDSNYPLDFYDLPLDQLIGKP